MTSDVELGGSNPPRDSRQWASPSTHPPPPGLVTCNNIGICMLYNYILSFLCSSQYDLFQSNVALFATKWTSFFSPISNYVRYATSGSGERRYLVSLLSSCCYVAICILLTFNFAENIGKSVGTKISMKIAMKYREIRLARAAEQLIAFRGTHGKPVAHHNLNTINTYIRIYMRTLKERWIYTNLQ